MAGRASARRRFRHDAARGRRRRGDRVYAAGDSAVKVFRRGGRLDRQWATAKPAWCVAVAEDGRVYVGEDGQIEIFDPAGRLDRHLARRERLGRVTAIGFVGGDVLARRCDRPLHPPLRRAREAILNNIGSDNRMQGFLIPNGVVDFGVDAEAIIHAANPGQAPRRALHADGRLLGHIGRFDGHDPAGFPVAAIPRT